MATLPENASTTSGESSDPDMDRQADLAARIAAAVVSALRMEPAGSAPLSSPVSRRAAPATPEAFQGSWLTVKNIPFIQPFDPKDPYARLGAKRSVDNPGRMREGLNKPMVAPETAIGVEITSHAALLDVLSRRRRAVACILAHGTFYKGQRGKWPGTGFLVGRNLLLTNHHVLNSIEVARTASVNFDYEVSPDDLLAGSLLRPRADGREFRLDPDKLFLTSPTEDGLDYTFVWIEEAASETYGFVPMERAAFPVEENGRAFVIHHPGGKVKAVSFDDADVLGETDSVVHYSPDTEEGSSGAPVFDRYGRLFALHHANRNESALLVDGARTDVVNEGVKLSAIAMDLETRVRSGGADAAYATEVLKEIKGSDTEAGFFGAMGREVKASQSATTRETVLKAYDATDQDIEIGFWMLEAPSEQAAIDGVAAALADLNLDICILANLSQGVVEKIVERIKEKYGNRYEHGFSEPAGGAKRTTAMLWRPTWLKGGRIEWPTAAERFVVLENEDGVAILDHYPGLFRFETVDKDYPFVFHVVPLRLDDMGGDALRRELASRLVARAVDCLAGVRGADVDIVIGGGMSAPLAAEDFVEIERKGFSVFGVRDVAAASAFTYLMAPKSGLREAFIASGMHQSVGGTAFFEVATDRIVPDYSRVSARQPIVSRLSLSPPAISAQRGGGTDIEARIDALLARGADSKPHPAKKSASTAKKGPTRRTRHEKD